MEQNKSNEIIIDGENAVLGRVASYAAKQALLGNKIIIVNCEKVIVVGNEQDILAKYMKRIKRGGSSQRGPYIRKTSEGLVKRTVRGMLPYKQGRGRDAYKRVICYDSMSEDIKEKKMIKLAEGKSGMALSKIISLLKGGI